MANQKQIKFTHPGELETDVASGGMTRLAGVSKGKTGAEGIHLGISTMAPGSSSTPHYHTNCESAIYVMEGIGLFLTGDDLSERNEIAAGDFIYVPDGAAHQPVNTSDSEPLVLIVARNTPVELVVELDAAGRASS